MLWILVNLPQTEHKPKQMFDKESPVSGLGFQSHDFYLNFLHFWCKTKFCYRTNMQDLVYTKNSPKFGNSNTLSTISNKQNSGSYCNSKIKQFISQATGICSFRFLHRQIALEKPFQTSYNMPIIVQNCLSYCKNIVWEQLLSQYILYLYQDLVFNYLINTRLCISLSFSFPTSLVE